MANSPYAQAARFEDKVAVQEEIDDVAIHFSRLSGIAPADVDRLRDFSRNEGLLVVIRCPKRPARYYHGKHRPKTLKTSIGGLKSDEATGLVTLPDGTKQVSDYDLMCVYRCVGNAEYEKVPFSGVDPASKTSRLPPEATALLRKVQSVLKSPFQHGAQDDYNAADNPNVKVGADKTQRADRFAVFNLGEIAYYATPELVKREVYDRFGLDWPYDDKGRHRAASA